MSELESNSLGGYERWRDALSAGWTNAFEQSESQLRSLVGLEGESERATHVRLYPTLDQRRIIDIAREDVVRTELLDAEESPFGALGGMRVFVRPGAQIMTRYVAAFAAEDEFDLDIRLGMAGGAKEHDICIGTADGTTCAAECQDDTAGCEDTDGCGQTDVCNTVGCPPPTRACRTEATCGAEKTCEKTCNQNTCQTCQTHCGTCETCRTHCGVCEEATRLTCAANECVFKK